MGGSGNCACQSIRRERGGGAGRGSGVRSHGRRKTRRKLEVGSWKPASVVPGPTFPKNVGEAGSPGRYGCLGNKE